MAKKAEKPEKLCQHCGDSFTKKGQLSHKQWATQRFCSIVCRSSGDSLEKLAARPPLEELFHSSYDKHTSGCWNWTGSISSQGYGVVRWRGRGYRAHMLSLELAGHLRQSGAIACHHCDNPRCVNPKHLYWGTPADNIGDASRRGRLLTGERHTQSKLTSEAVQAIRKSEKTSADLARQYGVSRPAIANARAGRTWRTIQ